MKLFKLNGYNLEISDEAYILEPFKKLWNRDKSANKTKALQELGFIYMMEDPRSDYQTFIDRDTRKEQIKIGEGLKKSWEPDKDVLAAMQFYASFKTEPMLLLDDLRVATDKVRAYMKTIDLSDTDDKGKPIYTLDSYTNTISKLTKLVKEIDETEKTITKDIIQSDKVRGTAEKSMYEDV